MEQEDIVSENNEDIFALADTKYAAIYNLICQRNAKFYNQNYETASVEEQRAALLKLHVLEAETFVKLKTSMFEALMAAGITVSDNEPNDE